MRIFRLEESYAAPIEVTEREIDKMGNLYAIRGAFIAQWKLMMYGASYLTFLGTLPSVIALAWIARASGSSALVAHVTLIAFLVVAWNHCVARVGRSLIGEMWDGTLDATLVSRTPLILAIFGKVLGFAALSPILGIIGVMAVLMVTQQAVTVTSPIELLVSAGLAIVAIIAAALFSTPIMVLIGLRRGDAYYDVVRNLIMIFSGVVYPIAAMPSIFQPVARALPMSYAVDGLLTSIGGLNATANLYETWALTLVFSAFCLRITYLLFRWAETRVREG